MRNSTKVTLAFALAIAAVIIVVTLGARKATVVVSQKEPQVSISMSPNGHIVRLTVTYWSTLKDVDARVDKFLEQHPELVCSGFQTDEVDPNAGYPAHFILLCYRANPPAEDAQSQTGPP